MRHLHGLFASLQIQSKTAKKRNFFFHRQNISWQSIHHNQLVYNMYLQSRLANNYLLASFSIRKMFFNVNNELQKQRTIKKNTQKMMICADRQHKRTFRLLIWLTILYLEFMLFVIFIVEWAEWNRSISFASTQRFAIVQ